MMFWVLIYQPRK